MNENVIKMARLMGGCKDITCDACLSRIELFGENKCVVIKNAEVLDKAGYRQQTDVAREFAERVLRDIGDAIDHNTWLIETFGSVSPSMYDTALITNNACKGIYDTVTAIAKEYGRGGRKCGK